MNQTHHTRRATSIARAISQVALVVLAIAFALLFWPVVTLIVESIFRGDWLR